MQIIPDIPTSSYDVRGLIFQDLPKDSYLDDISQPIPDSTHIFGSIRSCFTVVMDRLFDAKKCEVANATMQTDTIVAGIKRRQDRLHDRMLVSAANKFCPAIIGDNIVIPMERRDKMTSLGPRNMLGVFTDVSEGSYTV